MNLPRLTYDQSKRAYDLGFRANTEWWFPLERITNQPIHCLSHYGVTEDLFANPENQLFLMWCREVHNLHGWVAESLEHPTYFPLTTHINKWAIGALVYVKYEEAETALINYLLDLLEKKTK